jgi:hypothetical protein
MTELLTKFRSIFITNGLSGSLLVDTHRKETFRISKELHSFILSCEGRSIEQAILNNQDMNEEIVKMVIDQLLKDEILTSVPYNLYAHFQPISREWKDSSQISNSIIDFNEKLDYTKFVKELDALGCKAIQVRFFNPEFKDKYLIELCEILNNTGIRSIGFFTVLCGLVIEVYRGGSISS